MQDKFDFVWSPIFWQLFLVGVAGGLNVVFPSNVWVQGLSVMIGIWFGGSVSVNTINKYSEKKVEVAKINATNTTTTVTMPQNTTMSSATTTTDSNIASTPFMSAEK